MTNESFSGVNSFLHCTPDVEQGRLFELDSLWPSYGKINRPHGSQISQVSLMYSPPSNAWEGKAKKFLFDLASGELATVFRDRMDPGNLVFPLEHLAVALSIPILVGSWEYSKRYWMPSQ